MKRNVKLAKLIEDMRSEKKLNDALVAKVEAAAEMIDDGPRQMALSIVHKYRERKAAEAAAAQAAES